MAQLTLAISVVLRLSLGPALRRVRRGAPPLSRAGLISVCIALAAVSPPAARPAVPLIAGSARESSIEQPMGWPQEGHDAARTSLSAGPGPTNPRLIHAFPGFVGRLISPSGTIIAFSSPTRPRHVLALLSAGGPVRHLRTLSQIPAALEETGSVITVGYEGSPAEAISPTGRVLWRRGALGFIKGAEPLIEAGGRILIPAEGHPEDGSAGLYVLTAGGKLVRHVLRGIPVFAVAATPARRVYALTFENGHGEIIALSTRYRRLWTVPFSPLLAEGDPPPHLVVEPSGLLIVSHATEVEALDPRGGIAWQTVLPDQVRSLALRPDESIVAATNHAIVALSPRGAVLWRTEMQLASPTSGVDSPGPPSLAVDSTGRVYAGTSDGKVLVLRSDGSVADQFQAGGPHFGAVPDVLLGPHRMLAVTGTDGVLRVYLDAPARTGGGARLGSTGTDHRCWASISIPAGRT